MITKKKKNDILNYIITKCDGIQAYLIFSLNILFGVNCKAYTALNILILPVAEQSTKPKIFRMLWANNQHLNDAPLSDHRSLQIWEIKKKKTMKRKKNQRRRWSSSWGWLFYDYCLLFAIGFSYTALHFDYICNSQYCFSFMFTHNINPLALCSHRVIHELTATNELNAYTLIAYT